MPVCLTCHDHKIIQNERSVDGDEVVWSNPCPDCPDEVPRINPDTAEGVALLAAYRELQYLEDRKNEWPGADVVDIVTNLFTSLGFDLERHPDEAEQRILDGESAAAFDQVPQAHSRVEVVAYRDEDGGTDVNVFLDGRPITAEVTVVDPGAGWTTADWHQHRQMETERASPAAAALIGEHYDRGEHSHHITERV